MKKDKGVHSICSKHQIPDPNCRGCHIFVGGFKMEDAMKKTSEDEAKWWHGDKKGYVDMSRCKHFEGAMVAGDGPHICQSWQIKALKSQVKRLREELEYFLEHPTHSEFVHDYVYKEKGCYTCQHKKKAKQALKESEDL